MKEFSFRTRQAQIAQMKSEEFDFVIVGGGINGAGIARDSASRGLSVALVEANDFGFGTSSRSSKLVHGGIRYLENLEFHLVFEALSERRILFEIAPHLVHPLRFVLPIYRDSRVGMLKMGLGMWLYDALSLFQAPELHERLNPKETVERLPMVKEEGLLGSYVYSDAYMDDDRLTIETLRSAHELGACCANYVEAVRGEFDGEGSLRALLCRDKLSGEEFWVRASHFLGAVGPWTDQLGTKIFDGWKRHLRPSKGIHITLSRERLPLSQAMVMAVDREKRIIFAIPRNDMIIIGTTDTDFSNDLNSVYSSCDDIDYLLKVVGEYFPKAGLTGDDIVMSYAGVRPLVDDGSQTESGTSREHLILRHPQNMTLVMGGKYTTYRKMSEETVDAALGTLSRSRLGALRPSSTKSSLNPLCTTDNLARSIQKVRRWSEETGLSGETLNWLVQNHAMEVEPLLEIWERRKNIGTSIWALEALFAIHFTMCLHLVDFYQRRTHLMLAYKGHGLELLKELGALFALELQWSDSELVREIDQVKEHLALELDWRK